MFTIMIGASALFIAGCAAYFSVRGIALTFGAVSAFTIPIIIMASSLEFGKLIAASFLYRNWRTCHPTLRTYLLLAVLLLIGITSAGIYGYLSQAFEQTLSQVEGYEKEINSLTRQQSEYDRMILAYRTSGQKGSAMREEKQAEERARLESYIEERRKDIESAETSKTRLSEESGQMILGERKRREEEKDRLEKVISARSASIVSLEEEKKTYKVEVDERIARERDKEVKLNERLAQLDAAVKAYQDQGPGGFLKEDGFKKAAELLKTQAEEREGLRADLAQIEGSVEKARADLNLRYDSIDERIASIQSEISDANLKITSLTTGGAEQADNIRSAMESLTKAREAVDDRIASLELEIAEASKIITKMSESQSQFGPDSSEELENKKSELLTKKEDAERRILELEGNIRATDIGSFKFVARAFDSEVAVAEATENPILIKETMDRAVNRVVKWFILILVLVFDPLAVTLVIAYNASLLRNKGILSDAERSQNEKNDETSVGFFRMANIPILLLLLGVIGYFVYDFMDLKGRTSLGSNELAKASLLGKLSSNQIDDRAFAYVPQKAFGVCAFSGLRMLEEVGMPKIISRDLSDQIPFIEDIAWDPESCGIEPNGRAIYFLQFPSEKYRTDRSSDILFGLSLPIANEDRLKDFILRNLDLKAISPRWRIQENASPDYLSIHHKTSHISVGMDQHCIVFLTSWWSDRPDPAFLDEEMREVFVYGQGGSSLHNKIQPSLSGKEYDIALSLFGENFFDGFEKSNTEREMWNELRDFLSFDITLTANSDLDRVDLEAIYKYDQPVLNSDFGFKVRAKLDKMDDDSQNSLDSVYGEFAEVFLQNLDFKTVSSTLKRIDLTQSEGFESFDSIRVGSRERANSEGSISMNISSREKGGDALRLAVDLLVDALNPLRGEDSN